jgi:hypothetical protein
MARRLEKSGELLLVRFAQDPPAAEKRGVSRKVAFALAVIVVVAGTLAVSPLGLGWSAVGHTFKAFLAAVW